MNILIVTQYWHNDHYGGSYKVAYDQAQLLAQNKHRVNILCERFDDKLPKYEKTAEGIEIFRYGSAQKSNCWGGSSQSGIKDLKEKIISIKRKDYTWDVAILHHPFPAYGFFKAKLKIPAIYIFHASTKREVDVEGTTRSFSILQPLANTIFKLWSSKIEKTVLKKSTLVSVLSNFSKQILLETYPFCKNKVAVISSGIDLKKFTPSNLNQSRESLKISKNKKILLTVRRLTPRMGIENLIEAMKEVVKKHPDVRLLIIGQGNLKNTLQNKIDSLNLSTHIKLLGKVPENKLRLYYNSADIFVLPTIAFEGLGISTLESLSSGLPVIGTPIGATPEILNKVDKSLITKTISPNNLASKINEYLNKNEKEIEQLRKSCRQMVENNFNWDKAIKELENLLNSIQTHK